MGAELGDLALGLVDAPAGDVAADAESFRHRPSLTTRFDGIVACMMSLLAEVGARLRTQALFSRSTSVDMTFGLDVSGLGCVAD